MREVIQKITPFLWFNDQAEAAANFYVSIFKNSRIGDVVRYGDGPAGQGPDPAGKVMTVSFELEGQKFTALNGGPTFHFTEAISFLVTCESQEEVDALWEKLTAGGEEQPCGWLKDKFGVSWQIVPTALMEMMSDPDAEKVKRVREALFEMKKIDVPRLRQAYETG